MNLRRLVDSGVLLNVRRYDDQHDAWIFSTGDDADGEIVATLDRGNPKRSEIHKGLLDVLAGRSTLREGVRVKLGEMPERTDKDGNNLNEGKLQIIDTSPFELPPLARKVVRDGAVIGEWSKELDLAVDRYGDTAVMAVAYEKIAEVAANPDAFARMQESAIQHALAEAKRAGLEAFVDERALRRHAARTFEDAASGFEYAGPGKAPGQQSYNPTVRFDAQYLLPEGFFSEPPKASDLQKTCLASALMNYAQQKSMLRVVQDAALAVPGPDGGQTNVLSASEAALVAGGQLLYGHPKRTQEDFSRASREVSGQLGAVAIAGVMRLHGAAAAPFGLDPLKETSGVGTGDGKTFHDEVMEDTKATPDQATPASPKEALLAYLQTAKGRLERYAKRERVAVYEEQVKVVAPEKRKDLERNAHVQQPEQKDTSIKAIEAAAKAGAKGLQHATKFGQDVEGIGSM